MEEELSGWPEASDFDLIDMVSTFLDSIVHTCCGISDTAPLSMAYTFYVDFISSLFERAYKPGTIR